MTRCWRFTLDVNNPGYVLVKDNKKANELIGTVTRRALRHAPGLDLTGVCVPIQEDQADGFEPAIQRAHARLAKVRTELPTPDARFPRLPFLEICPTGGLPARRRLKWQSRQEERTPETEAISLASETKRGAVSTARKRFQDLLAGR